MSAKKTTKATEKKVRAGAKGASKAPGKATKSKAKVAKKAVRKPATKRSAKAAKKSQGKKGANSVDRRALFVQEYLIDLNATQAAIRAGYSPASARQTAADLLATAEIQGQVSAAMEARAERIGITQDAVLERLWSIATADPRQLIEVHADCCRYCYGIGHRFQRTRNEMVLAEAEHLARREALIKAGQPDIGEFDPAGGIGYDPRKVPNPECPECFGRGVTNVVPKDTRDLSPEARLLYAGAKVNQHGLEIKMHDQTGMLVNVGKHLGMFAKRVDLKGDLTHKHQSIQDVLDEIDGADTGLPGDGS